MGQHPVIGGPTSQIHFMNMNHIFAECWSCQAIPLHVEVLKNTLIKIMNIYFGYFGLIRGESSARHLRKCPAISCCPVQQAVVVGCTYSALFMSVLGQSAVKWNKEMFRGRKLGIIKTRTSRRVNFCTTT